VTDLQQLPRDARRDGIKKLVVGAVVHSAGRVLILRRSATDQFMAGIEELPSGGVEPGENLITALARELAEEIGWADIPPPDQGFTGSFDYLSGSGRKTRQYTFALAYDATPIILSGEHTAYRWIDPADLGDTDLTGETAQIVRDWAQSRHRPASVLSLCPRRRGRDGCPCPARTGHRWPRTPIATASRKVAGRPAARQMVLTQRWTPRRSFRRARAIAYETQAPATLDRPVALTRPASVP
jgi:8-oxo-dGTP diphosphatase